MIPIQRKKRWVLNILVAVLVTMTNACEKNSPMPEKYEYKYIGVNTGRVVTFDFVGKRVDNGHNAYSFEFCDTPSFLVCIYGEITLAIPKGVLKVGSSWDVAGVKFTVTDISSSGENVNYVIVSEPPSESKVSIFFNEFNGVWGLKFDDWEMYKSSNSCGLGCRKE